MTHKDCSVFRSSPSSEVCSQKESWELPRSSPVKAALQLEYFLTYVLPGGYSHLLQCQQALVGQGKVTHVLLSVPFWALCSALG